MNYRLGFQRLYAVLVVFWIAFVLVGSQSGRWKSLPHPPRPQADTESSRQLTDSELDAILKDKKDESRFKVSPEQFLHEESRKEQRHRALIYWLSLGGIAVAPPVLGYFFLFYVSIWIYRGFRPGTQI